MKVIKLNNYNFDKEDPFKIDAQGNEKNMILDSAQTILRNQPTIMCEIEQRHILFDIRKVL